MCIFTVYEGKSKRWYSLGKYESVWILFILLKIENTVAK